ALHRPAPRRNRPAADALSARQIECDRGADDVRDAVQGADLMEVDFLDWHPVDSRLRNGELAADLHSQLPLPGGQAPAVQDRLDVREEAIVLLVRVDDIDPGRREPVTLDLFDFECDGEAERIDRGTDRRRIYARIDQGGQGHVAADAAEAVEVQDAHVGPSSPVDLIRS